MQAGGHYISHAHTHNFYADPNASRRLEVLYSTLLVTLYALVTTGCYREHAWMSIHNQDLIRECKRLLGHNSF